MDQEIAARFKAQLAHYQSLNTYFDWRTSYAFSEELYELLSLIDQLTEPKVALELLALYFEADQQLCELCDDSNGAVGDTYGSAGDMLLSWSRRCEDQEYVRGTFKRLLTRPNDYGVGYEVEDAAKNLFSPDEVSALKASS